MRIAITVTLLIFSSFSDTAKAQSPSPDAQVWSATQALPSIYRADAQVMGYAEEGSLQTLREGTNEMICLADDPEDDRFHVACYHSSLEPFMEYGRVLRRQGIVDDDLERMRREAIERGEISMPEQAASLYSLTGPGDAWNPAEGTINDVRTLQVVYLPYATLESTGLPPRAPAGQPWLMDPGEPWAHIMILTPRPE